MNTTSGKRITRKKRLRPSIIRRSVRQSTAIRCLTMNSSQAGTHLKAKIRIRMPTMSPSMTKTLSSFTMLTKSRTEKVSSWTSRGSRRSTRRNWAYSRRERRGSRIRWTTREITRLSTTATSSTQSLVVMHGSTLGPRPPLTTKNRSLMMHSSPLKSTSIRRFAPHQKSCLSKVMRSIRVSIKALRRGRRRSTSRMNLMNHSFDYWIID